MLCSQFCAFCDNATRSHDDTLAARGMFTSMCCFFLRFGIYFNVSVETQDMNTSYILSSRSKEY